MLYSSDLIWWRLETRHAGNLLKDFYRFEASVSTWIEHHDSVIKGNSERAGAGFACVGGLLYLFGGNGSTG